MHPLSSHTSTLTKTFNPLLYNKKLVFLRRPEITQMARPGVQATCSLSAAAGRAAAWLALVWSVLAQAAAPIAPFEITGYAVEGAPLLRSADFSRIVAPFMGRQKSSADVKNAQRSLQQAYLDLGHCSVQVAAPDAEPQAGVVTFKVMQSTLAPGKDCFPLMTLDVMRERQIPVAPDPAAEAAHSAVTRMAASAAPPVTEFRLDVAPATQVSFQDRSFAQANATESAPTPAIVAGLASPETPPSPQAVGAPAPTTESKPAQRVAQAPAAEAAPADPAPAAPALTFDIDRYRVEGNTLLKSDAIAKILQPYVGKQKDFADVQRALEALQIAYQKAGWGAVQVTLPEQELERGEVRFEVIETRLGKIEIQGNEHFDAANVRRSVPSLKPGETPNSFAVSRSLKVANENPVKQSQVSLKAGSKDGEVDATIKVVDDNPRKYSVSLDNTGTGNTGQIRLGLGFQHSNLWNRDHQLTFQYITNPEHPNKVTVLGLGYHVPLYGRGDSMDLVLGYSTVDSGTVQQLFNVSGAGLIVLGRYNLNLNRIEDYEHKVTFGIDYKSFQNQVLINGTSLVPDITLHPVSIAYSGELRREKSTLNFYTGLTYNPLPGGNDAAQSDFRASRGGDGGASAEYVIWRYGVNYQRLFLNDWTLRLAANAQTTRNALVAGEQFGLGGANSVRGFNERTYSNDKGHQATVEVYTPDIASKIGFAGGRLKLLAFYDTGTLSRNFLQIGEQSGLSADSIGLGIRLTIREKFNLRVDYAQVKHDGGVDSGLRDGRRNSNTVHASAIFVY